MVRSWLLRLSLIVGVIGTLDVPSPCFQSGRDIDSLAAQYVDIRLRHDPTLAYALGISAPADIHLADRSPAALRRLHDSEDELLADLKMVSRPGGSQFVAMYFVLREELESRQGLRVCRAELWDLSQTQ